MSLLWLPDISLNIGGKENLYVIQFRTTTQHQQLSVPSSAWEKSSPGLERAKNSAPSRRPAFTDQWEWSWLSKLCHAIDLTKFSFLIYKIKYLPHRLCEDSMPAHKRSASNGYCYHYLPGCCCRFNWEAKDMEIFDPSLLSNNWEPWYYLNLITRSSLHQTSEERLARKS